MHTHIVKKHMIANADQLEIYVRGIEEINQTLDLIASGNHDASLAIKLSVPASVQQNPELFARVQDAMRAMPANVFQIYDPQCIGPGVSTRMAYFNEAFSSPRGIVVDADYDQVVLHTPEGLEAVMDLAKKAERDGAIFAIGSRNVPVVLGTHESNSNLRIIHEGVHSLAVGPDKLRAENPPQGVTPMYVELGESTSGVMMMNQTHPMYAQLASDMLHATKSADMNGFATNYFITLRAAQLGTVATGWALYDVNYYPSNKTEAEERTGVEKMVSYQTEQLGKTVVGNLLFSTAMESETEKRLCDFYPADQVDQVLTLMRNALWRTFG